MPTAPTVPIAPAIFSQKDRRMHCRMHCRGTAGHVAIGETIDCGFIKGYNCCSWRLRPMPLCLSACAMGAIAQIGLSRVAQPSTSVHDEPVSEAFSGEHQGSCPYTTPTRLPDSPWAPPRDVHSVFEPILPEQHAEHDRVVPRAPPQTDGTLTPQRPASPGDYQSAGGGLMGGTLGWGRVARGAGRLPLRWFSDFT